jgi:GT2 family glycosyltransferase
LRVTIIIPFHRNLEHLEQSLAGARRALPGAELLVAADGAVHDPHALATAAGARVLDIPGPLGPAAARNRAAAQAVGDILVFVDADVVAAPDALSGMCGLLECTPDVAAVFGAYDREPPAPNFMSQYKNLSHACVHEAGDAEARTFWAGLGAVRANVFREVAGFDERFGRPSVEDIEFGYRIRKAGHRIRLDPRFRGRHLKRWTLWNSIVTDIRARGIPWTQLIHRHGALANDLNTRHELRWSVVLTYLFVASLSAMLITLCAGLAAAVPLVALVVLNRRYYAWFVRQRGPCFALGVVPAHMLYHLCNGVSFAAGTVIYASARFGIRLSGAIAEPEWPASAGPSGGDVRAHGR